MQPLRCSELAAQSARVSIIHSDAGEAHAIRALTVADIKDHPVLTVGYGSEPGFARRQPPRRVAPH